MSTAGSIACCIATFSFCTKTHSAVIGCCLPWPKNTDVQVTEKSQVSMAEFKPSMVDSWISVVPKPFRSLCLCWYIVYFIM